MSMLSIKNITISAEDSTLVSKVSISIAPGELHVIMGPNGSGKSTLVNAVMGHPKYKICSGSITLGTKSLTRKKPFEKARAGLFLSMQYVPNIEGVTLAYFLYQVHKELSKEKVSINTFYASAIEKAKELHINDDLLMRPLHVGLSGGEKKQSEILQLALLKPRYAFLDEIDSGVDIDALENVFYGIEKLRKEGTGFILISHYPSILKKIKPHAVHIMKGGKIVKTGKSSLIQNVARMGFAQYV